VRRRIYPPGMFDNLKAMSALAGLMKNKDQLKAAGDRVRTKMEATRVTAGGRGRGGARVTVNGKMRVLDVELSPGARDGDGGGLEDTPTRGLADRGGGE
jgi:DNA-binding protein YbaB